MGAITRIVGCLAVIVVLFHDGVSLGLGQVAADQDAQIAVRAAAQNWAQNADVQESYDAAALAVAESGAEVDPDSFDIDVTTGLVTLEVTRETSTMMAHRFSWFDDVTNPTSSARASLDAQAGTP